MAVKQFHIGMDRHCLVVTNLVADVNCNLRVHGQSFDGNKRLLEIIDLTLNRCSSFFSDKMVLAKKKGMVKCQTDMS